VPYARLEDALAFLKAHVPDGQAEKAPKP